MTGEYKRRKSVFLPPEAVERTRYTCRNPDGTARLLERANIMDAIEALARIEEREMGELVVGQDRNQQRAAAGARERWSRE